MLSVYIIVIAIHSEAYAVYLSALTKFFIKDKIKWLMTKLW